VLQLTGSVLTTDGRRDVVGGAGGEVYGDRTDRIAGWILHTGNREHVNGIGRQRSAGHKLQNGVACAHHRRGLHRAAAPISVTPERKLGSMGALTALQMITLVPRPVAPFVG